MCRGEQINNFTAWVKLGGSAEAHCYLFSGSQRWRFGRLDMIISHDKLERSRAQTEGGLRIYCVLSFRRVL